MSIDRTIVLIHSHTHAGQLHAIGTELVVRAHDAERLIERGIASLVSRKPSRRAASVDAPAETPTQPTEITDPATPGDDDHEH